MTDWTALPRGHYALPITDNDGTTLGCRLFERVTPRTTKTGRLIGKHLFRFGATGALPGVDPDHPALRTPADYYDQQLPQDEAALLADPDRYRLLYGAFAGKCGWCGRRLTDKASRLVGIGPDCRAGLGWSLADVPRLTLDGGTQ